MKKAGIFRENCPVVIGEPNVPQTMLDQAEKLHCQVARRDVDWLFEQNAENWQWQNKKSAVRKFAVLSDSIGECRNGSGCRSIFTFDISEQTLRKSLQEVELVGRFQAIKNR